MSWCAKASWHTDAGLGLQQGTLTVNAKLALVSPFLCCAHGSYQSQDAAYDQSQQNDQQNDLGGKFRIAC